MRFQKIPFPLTSLTSTTVHIWRNSQNRCCYILYCSYILYAIDPSSLIASNYVMWWIPIRSIQRISCHKKGFLVVVERAFSPHGRKYVIHTTESRIFVKPGFMGHFSNEIYSWQAKKSHKNAITDQIAHY